MHILGIGSTFIGKNEISHSKTDEKALHLVKTRYWMVTGFAKEPEFTMTCMRVGREICPETQRPHWHASIQFDSDVRLKTLKQCFPKENLSVFECGGAHIIGHDEVVDVLVGLNSTLFVP
jgi:hypothetical protein